MCVAHILLDVVDEPVERLIREIVQVVPRRELPADLVALLRALLLRDGRHHVVFDRLVLQRDPLAKCVEDQRMKFKSVRHC